MHKVSYPKKLGKYNNIVRYTIELDRNDQVTIGDVITFVKGFAAYKRSIDTPVKYTQSQKVSITWLLIQHGKLSQVVDLFTLLWGEPIKYNTAAQTTVRLNNLKYIKRVNRLGYYRVSAKIDTNRMLQEC